MDSHPRIFGRDNCLDVGCDFFYSRPGLGLAIAFNLDRDGVEGMEIWTFRPRTNVSVPVPNDDDDDDLETRSYT